MERELCFCIEENNLYLEQVLVDYMEVPIFFLCKSEDEYYIALCTDFECLNYIVCNVSIVDVFNLLHGKLPMRDIVLKQNFFWEVISDEDISKDFVVKKNISQLDYTVLPEKGACFEILTDVVEMYVKKFDMEFFEGKYYYENNTNVEFNEMHEVTSYKLIDVGIEDYIEVDGRDIKSVLAVRKELRSSYMYDEVEYTPITIKVIIKKDERREQQYNNDNSSSLAA